MAPPTRATLRTKRALAAACGSRAPAVRWAKEAASASARSRPPTAPPPPRPTSVSITLSPSESWVTGKGAFLATGILCRCVCWDAAVELLMSVAASPRIKGGESGEPEKNLVTRSIRPSSLLSSVFSLPVVNSSRKLFVRSATTMHDVLQRLSLNCVNIFTCREFLQQYLRASLAHRNIHYHLIGNDWKVSRLLQAEARKENTQSTRY